VTNDAAVATVVAKKVKRKSLAQNNATVKIVRCSQSIYNVSILLAALWHAALAGYALVWIEQVFHKDLVFRTWVFFLTFSHDCIQIRTT